MKYLLSLFLSLSLINAFGQEQKLNTYQVPLEELRTYSKLHEMLSNEGTDCLSEINSTEGWAIWDYKFAIKKGLIGRFTHNQILT